MLLKGINRIIYNPVYFNGIKYLPASDTDYVPLFLKLFPCTG
jgi:hypothetical protein